MMPLIYFLLGILFSQFVWPLLEGLLDIILAYMSRKKLKITAKSVEIEQQINEIVNGEEPQFVNRQIGFVVENPDDYKTEEDEEDE